CIPALILTGIPWIQVVYHEHDSPTGSARCSSFMRLCFKARQGLASRARLIILPNEQRTLLFARETRVTRSLLTVWNCPRRAEAAHKHVYPSQGTLKVIYQGTVVPSRLPFTVVEALSMLPETVRLDVAGYETAGSAGYVGRLQDAARSLGVHDRVKFVGT